MTISILGCGWYGKALARSLIKKGVIVKGSSTSAENLNLLKSYGILPFLVHFEPDSQVIDPEFFDCDILVISIPPRFRHGESETYLSKIERIIKAVIKNKIVKVIYISSTAVYGDINKEVNELTAPEPDTESGRLLYKAEALFHEESSFKTTIIRFAGLVGPHRHPGNFFSGKKNIPNGLAPVNLIHQDDCVGITNAVIDRNVFGGLFNASSPDHPTKAAFYRYASAQAKLPAPEFINQLLGYKTVSSIFISNVLRYKFKVPVWEKCSFI